MSASDASRRGEAEHFLTRLDENAAAFLFAAFDDAGNDRPPVQVYGNLDQLFPQLAELNGKGFGIYVTVNATDGPQRKAENVVQVRAVFRDWDNPEAARPPLPVEPSLSVCTSPGKFHDYVLVDDLPLADFTPVQRRLVQDYGSDKAVIDLPRVMRLPGFYNRKPGAGNHLVSIVQDSGSQNLTAAELLKVLPPVNAKVSVKANGHDPGIQLPADEWQRIGEAMRAISPDCSYDEWLKVGQALHATGDPRAFARWDGWSQLGAKYPGENELQRKWAGFTAARGVTLGSLFHIARSTPRDAKAEDAAPGASGRRKLQPLVWMADVNPVLSQAYVVKENIGQNSLVAIYGESNSGKSFYAVHLGLHVAGGQLFFGHAVRPGLVVYVAAEGGHGIRNRLAAYRQEAAWTRAVPLAVLPQPVDLLDPEADTALLIEAIKVAEGEAGVSVGMVVLDTLARVMVGGDENTTIDMSAFIANADRIRTETGATVVIVHHAGKDKTKGARGSSALRAALDTEILVEGQEGTRTVTVTKQRDLPSGQRYAFELVPVTIGVDDDGQPVTSCVVAEKDTPASAKRTPNGKQQIAILRLLEAQHRGGNPIIPTGEIKRLAREHLGIAKSSAQSAVLGLVSGGFLINTIGGLSLTDPPGGTR